MDTNTRVSDSSKDTPSFDWGSIEADIRRRIEWAGREPGRLGLIAVFSDPDVKDKSHERITAHNVPVEDVERAVKEALTFLHRYETLRHWNVFASLHVLKPDIASNERGGSTDCIRVFGLIADCDTDKSLNREIEVEPTFAINTSPGNYQKAFIFDTPVPYTNAKHVAEALRAATSTDTPTADAVHYWRIDGTLNWPDWKKVHERNRSREPFPVRITSGDVKQRYISDQLLLALKRETAGPSKAKPKAKPEPEPRSGQQRDVETLLKTLPLAYRALIEKPEAQGERSESTFALLGEMVRKGWTTAEIVTVVERFPHGPFERNWKRGKLDEAGLIQEIVRMREAQRKSGGASPEVVELAALDPLEYDRRRKEAAAEMGVRTATLDKEVAAARKGAQATGGSGRAITYPEIEPWPEPVDGAKLLSDLSSLILRYVDLSRAQADITALWAVGTHLHASLDGFPILVIRSPTKRCGKTRLLTTLSRLVSRAQPMSGVTAPALLRLIDLYQPTAMVDEFDALLKSSEEMSEALRGLLNSCVQRATAIIIKSVTIDNDWGPRAFSTWAPVAVSGIGKVPETVADRAVEIELQRKSQNVKVARLRTRDGEDLNQAARQIVRFVQDHREEIVGAEPKMPASLNDRQAEGLEPLIAIADVAGGEWPERARAAVVGQGDENEDGGPEQLIRDIRTVFDGQLVPYDQLSSAELTKRLLELSDHRYRIFKNGNPLTKNLLARALEPFHVRSKDIWLPSGKSLKGYARSQFADAFERYA